MRRGLRVPGWLARVPVRAARAWSLGLIAVSLVLVGFAVVLLVGPARGGDDGVAPVTTVTVLRTETGPAEPVPSVERDEFEDGSGGGWSPPDAPPPAPSDPSGPVESVEPGASEAPRPDPPATPDPSPEPSTDPVPDPGADDPAPEPGPDEPGPSGPGR